MVDGESYWIDRAQTCAASFATYKEAMQPALEKYKNFKATMGIKEKQDGALEINFDRFVAGIGVEKALELRALIDETYSISGAAGEKPKMRVAAG